VGRLNPWLAVLWLACVAGVVAGTGAPAPEIVAVYPDPVADGDAGEFVVIDVPEGVDATAYNLSDGETTVALPAVRPGRVAVATGGSRPARMSGYRTVSLEATLQLANTGEELRLRHDESVVDAMRYDDTKEGELRVADDDGRRWRPLGATDRPVITAGPGRVRAFVLPDAGGLPARFLGRADERIRLAGYTLTSRRVTDALVAAHRRNVSVRVLVDGAPVGGMATAQVRRLNRLARAGVDVRVLGGPRARYRFHHPKYAVVDDRALVTTENWKPAGVGGRASRGWGVVTNQSAVVAGLAATFRADATWRDAIPWVRAREDVDPVEAESATGRFGRRTAPARLPVSETRLLVAPDNAEASVVDLLAGANESIWIEQPSVGGRGQPFVGASVAAARRGVAVRLLLGSAWYNEEPNRATAERLRALAAREGLDLEVRLVEPRGRFERIHAKGVVVDGETVVLGSLNWNNNSVRNNREVALVLRGEAVGDYFESVIRADWRGGEGRLLVGLAAITLLGALVAVRVGRRIEFEAAS
jgi:phosphatidylserine/phosphatidylglycerophosphate/cardiolipin synthase-like enzyme